jgi:class 3 adenylate cyclase/tetratricopeptide (TPR) repeat protein
MDTLASWLQSLGLGQYVALFESQGIDLRSLPLLCEADLIQLGVLLGHRRILLKAVSTLVNEAPVASRALQLPTEAERRQLTVLFCDLVGSTRLAQQIDAEILRDLMHAYQRTCGAILSRYAGHVAQYLGDGIVAYFGFPEAHEDDAERAVRAALEIVAAVGRVPAIAPLQVHVGIATGSVVVGKNEADDDAQPNVAVGETPNLDARLAALAGPDQIVVSSRTHRLLGNTFTTEDLGEHVLKGIGAAVKAYAVRGLARNESRFDATRKSRYVPFVGRESELALLLSRWRGACNGDGHVVLLTGEPGIGKSRIARVMSEKLVGSPHLRQLYQCSPYHCGSAFYPLVGPLERACGIEPEHTLEQKLDRLEGSLAFNSDRLPLVAPFFASLLSLPTDRYPPQMLAPQKHREQTIVALVEQILHLAKRQPILMICEDAQWADPATLETMALMVEQVREAAVLLIVTGRPDFVPAWSGHSNVTPLHLNRLSKRQGEAIAVQLVGGKRLPEDLLTRISERTDGVPLFVEELTQAVLESGLLHDAGDHWELRAPLPPLAIPSTIQDSLMARLDHLGSTKEIAQIAACVGREFDYELLSAIVPTNEAGLQDALARLVDSGLVFRQRAGREATYTFKHALVREVAYDGLLMSRRKQIHAAIAHTLAGESKDSARSRPELLALHLTRADLVELALPQWRIAARSAMAKNRHREALDYVDAGLALIDRTGREHRADHEVALHVKGAACHWVLTGYACQQAANLWAHVEELVDQVSEPRLSITALCGIATCAYVGAETQKALVTAERLMAQCETASDIDSKVVAYSSVGPILHQQGQFTRCAKLLRVVLDSYKLDPQTGSGRINDPKVTACNWLSRCELAAGRLDQAEHYARLAVAHATEIGQPFILSMALGIAARTFAETGDEQTTFELCDRCIELCDTQNLPFWKGWAMACDGVALERGGEHEQAQTRLAQALEYLAARGARVDTGYICSWRAQALAHLGRFDEARREIETSRCECESTGQLLLLDELAYSRGVTEALAPGSDHASAEHWFNVALTDSRSHGLRLIELRAATSVARLWKADGKRRQADDMLRPVVSAFSEGMGRPDIAAAIALLDGIDIATPKM